MPGGFIKRRVRVCDEVVGNVEKEDDELNQNVKLMILFTYADKMRKELGL